MPAQKPISGNAAQQVIITMHSGASDKISYIQPNDSTESDKNELASKIIDDAVAQLKANLKVASLLDDTINNIGVILNTPIMQFLHDVQVHGNKYVEVAVIEKPASGLTQVIRIMVADTLDQDHLIEISLGRQFMAKDTIRPVRIQIKPYGLSAYSMADTGLIDPEGLGNLELASDISDMVAFYARKVIDDAGKTQGHSGVHASLEELKFHMDSFGDDIYAFAKDSTSSSLSVNMSVCNNRNEISKVRVDIERTREWRNPN